MTISCTFPHTQTVIELVLGTDMKQHFAIASQFATVHRLNTSAASIAASYPHKQKPASGEAATTNSLTPLHESERLLSLQVALKVADLSNLARDLPTYLRWMECLEEECFRQGDAERAAGLPISPLYDREKPGISKSQVGFIEFVAFPLYNSFTEVFQGARPLVPALRANYQVSLQLI